MPTPSPRTYPFALASNALQRPSGESIDALPREIETTGESIALTPPANASEH